MTRAALKTKSTPTQARSMRRLRCALYARSATAENDATARQLAECESYVRDRAEEGWIFVGQPYVDVGASGMNLDRPGLARLLRDAQAGRFDRVVVVDVARVARDVRLVGDIVHRLEQAGVDVTTAGAEPIDVGALLGRVGG